MRRALGGGASAVLHVLAVILVMRAAAHIRLPLPPPPEESRIVVVRVDAIPPAGPDAKIDPKSEKNASGTDLGIQPPQTSTLSLPGFTFDFRKVIARAGALFPFLTGRVALERLVARPARATGLANPFSRVTGDDVRLPPLVLTPRAMQQIVDETWSRRDRWRAFQPIARMIDGFDPDEGALPQLLRAYGTQNGLQPYVDVNLRDPRFWTQLGLAADHADFVDFVADYASRHPSTRTTTELLFLLDKLVQASFDALTVLLDTDPFDDLKWTWAANRTAFIAVVKIRDYYRAELASRRLTSREELQGYYDAARLAILTMILDTTPRGYRAGDAAFLIGAIHWNARRTREAVTAWSAIEGGADDEYRTAYSEALAVVRKASPGKSETRQIDRLLQNERGRWLAVSSERLRQFGYRFDTF